MGASIEGVVTQRLGLASHQNAVPLLRSLTLANDADTALENLTLELTSGLPFVKPRTWAVDRLDAGATLAVGDREVLLQEDYLAGLSESVRSSVRVSLRDDVQVIAECDVAVELLAHNEWGGAASMPELLAAFCMPNDPAVDKLLKAASEVLHAAGRPDGLDGYRAQSRQRVWELASALWSAVCGFAVSYALPPASFEEQGQKVRTPTRILETRVATCLDTALLFAAALEQVGLNAVLVLTRGHAFTGVWLQPAEFAQVANDDASALRKRIELDELLVFETTLATQSAAPAFSHAIEVGVRQLSDEDFVLAVDMRRARMHKLRPLNVMLMLDDGSASTDADVASVGLESAPVLPTFDVEPEAPATTPAGRVQRWQRKLLDLTTRNRLLHVSDSAKVVRLLCPDPAALEDLLADKRSVRVVPLPALDVGGRDSGIYEQRQGENLVEELARQAMTRGEVTSRMEADKLDAALVDLYRKSRADLREGGSNTLFLALGFLRWKKAKDDPRDYFAPLILLPVKLERTSARSHIKLSRLDDEPRFNLTLLELLRHDFALTIDGLDGDLPTDASGLDVEGVWKIVERAVRDVPGFEVVKDVMLGTFSFAKYLMWRDLTDRTEALQQSEVVQLLLHHVAGESAAPAGGDYPQPRTLDREVAPGELFTPLPADSSQLAAVVASARGQNFVLDGPPGTGKSQTIANMIAHNLALGRRVLFVAEKMAALDVVKRRLEEQGIGEFCLELHSSKSSKQHVLDQLDRAWTSAGAFSQEQWDGQAQKVQSLRDKLNGLVAVLHKRWPNGWSVHAAVGRVVRDGGADTVDLAWPEYTTHTAADMEKLRDLARRLDLHRDVVTRGGPPMAMLRQSEWSNAWQQDVVALAQRVTAALDECEAACRELVHITGLPVEPSLTMTTRLLSLARTLPEALGIDMRFAFASTARAVQADVAKAMALLREWEQTTHSLSLGYPPPSIRRIDVDKLESDWALAGEKFWLLADLARHKVTKALATEASLRGMPDVVADLSVLRELGELETKIKAFHVSLRHVPGWAGLDSDTVRIGVATRLADKLHKGLLALATSPEQLLGLRRELRKLVVDGNDLLARNGVVAQAVTRLTNAGKELTAATAAFAEAAACEVDLEQHAQALRETAAAVVANQPMLQAWCGWRRVRDEAVQHGLEPLIEAVEADRLRKGSVAEAFETAYARWFAARSMDAEPLLRHFAPAEHESDIEAFARAVDELSSLTQNLIRARLAGQVPDKNDLPRDSGFAVLKHELQKHRQHKPVRQLAQAMGPAFDALAPCMLMSPLSIAQYLPADHPSFDLVIFDEASQIAPWDAVGSIARGKQVVMAGDPRQMPPTSFFNRGAGAEEDDTGEDLESILDECLAAGVPQHSLSWHYRSRHESLIQFSNHTYYDGSLVTFPAADTRPSVVRWRKVDGVYARGRVRHNAIEAKAIVAEVVARLSDAAFVDSGQSIGIITLNIDQQQLIEDLLDQARKQHPAIEPFFDADLSEPVVVKNLETMQGDERDLIILGIGFGPTEPGASRMSMNFGPLNRDGGWRRLNVAITRARREMLVFTSFDASMIDLNRTSARAVRELRHFIEFAERGPQAIAAQVDGSQGGFESPFEEAVAHALQAKGWQVVPQIGVSRFRIDLGIVHPDRPGDYLAGVECDGASYHSAATARDRDKVREAILRGLGWNLLRVWSTHWWVDRDGALERLHQALTEVLAASRDEPSPATSEPVAPGVAEPNVVATEPMAESVLAEPPKATPVAAPEPEALPQVASSASESAVPDMAEKRVYQVADMAAAGLMLDAGQFHEPFYAPTLQTLIKHVVAFEAPILDKLLVDRIARAHDFRRSGRLIRERVLQLAQQVAHFEPDPEPDHGAFVWPDASAPARWNSYRVPAEDAEARSIEEIPWRELAAAAQQVQGEDVPMQLARLFGVQRLSSTARARIESLLVHAENHVAQA